MDELFCISPIDGRYHKITEKINPYFSEYALIKYRLTVEIKWLLFLLDKKIINEKINVNEKKILLNIINNFSLDDAKRVKEIENDIKHDVKSIEYFLQEKFKENNIERLNPFIHILLTSEDVNNVSYNLMINDMLTKIYYPKLEELINKLDELSLKYKNISMLSHTHGQPASPTTFGKELKIFSYRIESILTIVKKHKLRSKFSGAVGNYNCHVVAFPNINWINETKEFIEKLNLEYNPLTTQIESHDYLCILLSYIKIINNIIKDFNNDMWLYISKNYIKEKINKNEVGSSVMPHKVNPINHENSMANIEISNSIIDALINNLSISRMQRDLTDSSKLRNIGVIFSHSLISIDQTIIGINKIEINKETIDDNLKNNYQILTEAIQTVLRKNKKQNAYEELKKLSRGNNIDKKTIIDFIKNLDIDIQDKETLLNLEPINYIGLAEEIVLKNQKKDS